MSTVLAVAGLPIVPDPFGSLLPAATTISSSLFLNRSQPGCCKARRPDTNIKLQKKEEKHGPANTTFMHGRILQKSFLLLTTNDNSAVKIVQLAQDDSLFH